MGATMPNQFTRGEVLRVLSYAGCDVGTIVLGTLVWVEAIDIGFT